MIWRVGPGVVAEVRADGVSDDEALAVAQTVREVDERTWRDLAARFRALRAKANAQGLDRDSDIVAVVDDLLAAMQADDADEVRSIPVGGCR